MSARKKRKLSAPKVRCLSRPLLLQMLLDLCSRTENQRQALDAIAAVNIPNGLHIVAEHRLRTENGILLDNQLKRLRDIEEFTRIIRGRAGPPGDYFTQNQPVDYIRAAPRRLAARS